MRNPQQKGLVSKGEFHFIYLFELLPLSLRYPSQSLILLLLQSPLLHHIMNQLLHIHEQIHY